MFLSEAGQRQPLMGEDRGDTYKIGNFEAKTEEISVKWLFFEVFEKKIIEKLASFNYLP